MSSDRHAPDLTTPLDDVAVRALGALVEKSYTTPDNYPLSLNALTAACSQTSNREPVMVLDEAAVAQALRTLIERSLAREVHRSDSRVKRYRHLLEDTLHLHDPEQAALCVLLLRGPQTLGEIKARTARMLSFLDLAHVEITLQGLATLPVPLVVQLPRQPGQKEVRYAHTLSGTAQQMVGGWDPTARESTHAAGAPDSTLRASDDVPVATAPATTPARPLTDRVAALEEEVAGLRAELDEVRAALEAFRREFQ